MNSPAIDIKSLLVAMWKWDVATSRLPAVEFHASSEPAKPDAVVTCYDTGGWDPAVNMLLDEPTVEVRVRGPREGYQEAYAVALWVRDALHAYGPASVGGTRYLAIQAVGEPTSLGYDNSRRPSFSLNFRMHREPTAAGTTHRG